MIRATSPKKLFRRGFTDRDQGEGFVLSAHRAASWAGKSKHIKPNRVNSAGYRRMKCKLLGMCQNVGHLDKQVVNWVQMYNNNLYRVGKFLL